MEAKEILQIVADHYGIKTEYLSGLNRTQTYVEARKMYCYLSRELPRREVARTIGLNTSTVRYHTLDMRDLIPTSRRLSDIYEKLTIKLYKEMTVKITNSQLRTLHNTIRHFIENGQTNHIADELVFLHLDDIAEKIRKRLRADKKNLALDEKQQRALVIWYIRHSETINDLCQQTVSILIFIINQIKPDERKYQDDQSEDRRPLPGN